jgi:hypothetical protein
MIPTEPPVRAKAGECVPFLNLDQRLAHLRLEGVSEPPFGVSARTSRRGCVREYYVSYELHEPAVETCFAVGICWLGYEWPFGRDIGNSPGHWGMAVDVSASITRHTEKKPPTVASWRRRLLV